MKEEKSKTRLLYRNTYLFMRSAYPMPEMHKHLAVHLLFAVTGKLVCQIGKERVYGRGICIASDIEHTAAVEDGEMLVFLFDETSNYALQLKERFLMEQDYAVLDEVLAEEILTLWESVGENTVRFDHEVFGILGITGEFQRKYDERVQTMLRELEEMETITPDTFDILSRRICLSKSRMSHLFKENVGIAPNRYLVLEKMRKCYEYYIETGNLTEACMRAGFDSSSHFAGTCKRMFGISFSEFAKSMK